MTKFKEINRMIMNALLSVLIGNFAIGMISWGRILSFDTFNIYNWLGYIVFTIFLISFGIWMGDQPNK
jgi:hypothetical protein